MKVQKLIMLAFGLSFIILLSIIIINYLFYKQRQEARNTDENQKKKYTVNVALKILSDVPYKFVKDYTNWDDLVNFIDKPDTSWSSTNLSTIIQNADLDYVWLYNLSKKQIYYSRDSSVNTVQDPLAPFAFDLVFDTISNSKKRFCHYYLLYDKKIIEISGATVHLTNDLDRKQKAHGFFFVGRILDQSYVSELKRLTRSDVGITKYKEKVVETEKNKFQIEVDKAITDWKGKPFATMHFTSVDYFQKKENEYNQVSIVLYFIIILIVLLIFYLFVVRRINRSLSNISKTLDSGKIEYISRTRNQSDEFGQISNLIFNFFAQKSELVREIDERKKVESELKYAHDILVAKNEEISQQKEDLQEFNEELNQQKEEIQAQADLLESVNIELTQQKEELLQKSVELTNLVEELNATNELINNINEELHKLSLVASKTDNSVVIFDSRYEIEWVNDGFSRMLGVSVDEFKREYGTNLFSTSLNPDIKEAVNECLTLRKSVMYSSKTITKSGRLIWLQTTLTPIFDDNDNLEHLVAIDSDITKIKLAEKEIADQHKNITRSIHYASRIQKAVMPSKELITKLLPNNFIYFKPRDIVSGDIYWLMEKQEKIVFAVMDCTGHGVPGAFMSILCITFLHDIVSHSSEMISTNEVLEMLRDEVIKALHQTGKIFEARDGMDIALCVYDPKKKDIEYSGANIPLYIVRKGEIIEYKPSKMPIGIHAIKERPFSKHNIQLQNDDLLYLFSDGYVSQFGGPLKRKFLRSNFKNLILQIYQEPMEKQLEILDKDLNDWKGKLAQVDDILVMGIKFQ